MLWQFIVSFGIATVITALGLFIAGKLIARAEHIKGPRWP